MNKDKIDYHHYPGILGQMDFVNGGNKLNLVRWAIQKLINLNNWIERRKKDG